MPHASDTDVSGESGLRETLDSFRARVCRSENLKALGFVVVNGLYDLFPFRQSFLLTGGPGGLKISAISGLADIERHSPFIIWFEQFCCQAAGDLQSPAVIARETLPAGHDLDNWNDWLPEHLLLIPLRGPDRSPCGLLVFACDTLPDTLQLKQLFSAAELAEYALWALSRQGGFFRKLVAEKRKKALLASAAALAALIMLFPVKQSVLADAEIAPLEYSYVTASMDGVIKTVHVKPNQLVQQGELLATLDDTTLRNKLAVSVKTLGVTQTEAFLAQQKAFADAQSKGEMATRQAQVHEKRSETGYLREMLIKTEIRAPRSGIVMFGDASDWEGRPVMTGERIMQVADADSAGVLVWLPVADAIAMEKGGPIRFFRSSDPLHPLDARILQSSYQSYVAPSGIASYRVLGEFTSRNSSLRIGLKGTAKIYGKRVILAYYLFRRPLAALRQFTGL